MTLFSPKRLRKWRGFVNYFSSLISLRYTRLHHQRLQNYFATHPVTRLHIGCGHVLVEGWLNIYFDTHDRYGQVKTVQGKTVLNYNLLKPWPFPDRSVDFIAGSHIIEHLDLNAGIKLLSEAYRVLKPGGRIWISCPDLELYARRYIERDDSFFNHPKIREWCAFRQAETFGEILAAKAYDSGGAHKWFYDFESLNHILEKAQFKNIRRARRSDGKLPDLDKIELKERELETVYVEAER